MPAVRQSCNNFFIQYCFPTEPRREPEEWVIDAYISMPEDAYHKMFILLKGYFCNLQKTVERKLVDQCDRYVTYRLENIICCINLCPRNMILYSHVWWLI